MLQMGPPRRPWARWWSLVHPAAGEKVMGCGVVKPPWCQPGPYSCPKDELSFAIRAWVVLVKGCQGQFQRAGERRQCETAWWASPSYPFEPGWRPLHASPPPSGRSPQNRGEAVGHFGLFHISG